MKKSLISLLLVLISLTIIYRNHKSKREIFIFHNGFPAIGEVYKIVTYSKGGSNIKYRYQVKRMHYGRIGKPIPVGLKEDDKYLVLYLEKAPRESILLLDKPIKDSTDFQRYVNEFETMRKKQNK